MSNATIGSASSNVGSCTTQTPVTLKGNSIKKPTFARLTLVALAFFLVHVPVRGQDSWEITDSIPLDANIVDLIKDPKRDFLYALDRVDSKVLFIDLQLKTISELYVGKLPTSLAIDDSGDKLYVANRGTGSGTSAGYQIAVVDLATQTKTHHFLTTHQPVNILIGQDQRLYYNNGDWEFGNIHDVSGNTGVVDLNTETELGSIGGFRIKSHMVMNDDRTKLYGQYIYSGNLGEMGVFDIDTTTAFKLDDHPYSPYPYGWDYNNYSISANGERLAYGYILFNADNLLIQYGVFLEQVYALNEDGSIAFGLNSVWDTSTFATTGDATILFNHDLDAQLMRYDSSQQSLYAFSPTDFAIKKLEVVSDAPPPVPDVKVNGSDVLVRVAPGESLDITISMSAGSLANEWADWTMEILTATDSIVFLDGQHPFFDLSEFSVFDSPLPSGFYIALFGLDANPDGVQEYTYMDWVPIVVSGAPGSTAELISHLAGSD